MGKEKEKKNIKKRRGGQKRRGGEKEHLLQDQHRKAKKLGGGGRKIKNLLKRDRRLDVWVGRGVAVRRFTCDTRCFTRVTGSRANLRGRGCCIVAADKLCV